MYTSILSATLHGLEAIPVQVEVDVSSGLPGFSMVGNLSSQVREAAERVRTALHNTGISLPPSRITVNLSPGDVPKNGTGFDLPIAGGILSILGKIPASNLKDVMITGEVGLDGKVRGVRGILSMMTMAKDKNCHACIVPMENMAEAMMMDDLKIVGVSCLEEFVETVRHKKWNETVERPMLPPMPDENCADFSDICGQISAKRAALLAASGFHNLLLMGPPGSGKTMIASRLPGLLPELTMEESMELTRIYSVAGMLPKEYPMIRHRPFRSPHHTISPQALVGGGRIPEPGEITLAHRGVLFLDELPEMRRSVIDLLRQPLEEKQIMIARMGGRYYFPSEFLLVAAMNPCPCGYYPDRNRCNCSEQEISRYMHRVSQPFLDRIDLCAETVALTYSDFRKNKKNHEWTSAKMRQAAVAAHQIQKERYKNEEFHFNGEIPTEKIGQYCIMETNAEKLLKQAFSRLGLTGRGYSRILKVARTAADLDAKEVIEEEHMAEAIGYRGLDRNNNDVI
ncbi:MAG: YifB family Mg chelatase-like AAA ATPase [Oliverpabstia sp.]|nr:YifB family Mg chelatase-like AAA ATPase [Oliverpabstia sp.]